MTEEKRILLARVIRHYKYRQRTGTNPSKSCICLTVGHANESAYNELIADGFIKEIRQTKSNRRARRYHYYELTDIGIGYIKLLEL